MNIEVTWVEDTPKGTEVWFKDPVFEVEPDGQRKPGGQHTALGVRAWRVLHLFLPDSSIFNDLSGGTAGRCFFLAGRRKISGLRTLRQAQAHMNRWANVKLAPAFYPGVVFWADHPVGLYSHDRLLETPSDIDWARANNKIIKVGLVFSLKLPIHLQDLRNIVATSPTGTTVAVSTQVKNGVNVETAMVGRLARQQPSQFIATLKEKIQAAIT